MLHHLRLVDQVRRGSGSLEPEAVRIWLLGGIGAAALFGEGPLLKREPKYKTAIFFGPIGMAGAAALRGQPARVAKPMGASEALREEIDLSLVALANARYDYEGYLSTARAGLVVLGLLGGQWWFSIHLLGGPDFCVKPSDFVTPYEVLAERKLLLARRSPPMRRTFRATLWPLLNPGAPP